VSGLGIFFLPPVKNDKTFGGSRIYSGLFFMPGPGTGGPGAAAGGGSACDRCLNSL
jgi:hypothetical protein